MSQASFEPLAQALAAPLNLVDATLERLTLEAVAHAHRPMWCWCRCPFPGAVYAAFRIAQAIKAQHPAHPHRAGRRLREHRVA